MRRFLAAAIMTAAVLTGVPVTTALAASGPAAACTWQVHREIIRTGSNPTGQWVKLTNQNCGLSYKTRIRCNNIGQTFWRNGPARTGGAWSKANCSPAFADKFAYQYFGTDSKWHTVALPNP